MSWTPRLRRGKPAEGLDIDVRVEPGDVRVAVVKHIVLPAPHVRAGPQHVEGECHDEVHAFPAVRPLEKKEFRHAERSRQPLCRAGDDRRAPCAQAGTCSRFSPTAARPGSRALRLLRYSRRRAPEGERYNLAAIGKYRVRFRCPTLRTRPVFLRCIIGRWRPFTDAPRSAANTAMVPLVAHKPPGRVLRRP